MGQLLDLQAILGAKDIVTEDVEVPEWGGTVRVTGLNGLERDQFESTLVEQKGKKTRVDLRNARARLVSMTVVDEAGKRVFSPDHVGILGTKSAAALDRVYTVAARLSGLTDEDMDELTGNSDATTSAGSPSA